MAFPDGVVLTTVIGEYLDVAGKPAKGTVAFLPDLSAVGEGISVAPVSVRKKFDADGKFTLAIPASVNTGLDPDFTYKITWQFDGGEYRSRIVQIPVSEDPINIDDLIQVAPSSPVPRFQLPMYAAAPVSPQPGQMYYNTVEGAAYVYDDVADVWVDLTASGGGGGGTPSGPAGGSLAGTYPNPTIKAAAVGTTQLADASVTAAKLTVSYVPTITHNADLATISTALGDLEEADTALGTQIAGKANTVHTHVSSDVTDLQGLLNAKAPIASPNFTGTVSGITAAMVGLGNVNNTSDANKPVSSATATALAAKADLVGGVIPTAQLPALAINDTFTVASEAAMLALTAQRGDMAVRSDTTPATVYVLAVDNPAVLTNWVKVSFGAIQSVNGQTGVVVLGKSDVGLSNVDNTSDADKPLSTAATSALAAKAPIASPTFTGTVSGVSKAMVGLGNVDNTSNATERAATATLANKTLSSPAFTGTPTGLTKTHVGLANVDNTADTAKPVSTAQQAALDAKPNVLTWNGSAYVISTTGDIYIGPNDPGAVPDGSVWIDTTP